MVIKMRNKKKITRIFECENGHRYKSKHPITTSWAEEHLKGVKLFFSSKANDRCKICGAAIVKEDDYVIGEIVMGAVRITDSKIKLKIEGEENER